VVDNVVARGSQRVAAGSRATWRRLRWGKQRARWERGRALKEEKAKGLYAGIRVSGARGAVAIGGVRSLLSPHVVSCACARVTGVSHLSSRCG
jgi:hypothetical protein